jgi:hypothetical protein
MNLRVAFAGFGALAWVAATASPDLAAAETGAAIAEIKVVGTDFHVNLTDGRVLAGADLVGTVLTVGDGANRAPLRIDAVQPDPKDPSGEILSMRSRLWIVRPAYGETCVRPTPMGLPWASRSAASGHHRASIGGRRGASA